MKFYEVIRDHSETDPHYSYFGTLASAHAEGKTVDPADRPNVRITEVEVGSDKEAVLALLNEALGTQMDDFRNEDLIQSRGRVWKLSTRGGLVELTPEPEDVGTTPHQ